MSSRSRSAASKRRKTCRPGWEEGKIRGAAMWRPVLRHVFDKPTEKGRMERKGTPPPPPLPKLSEQERSEESKTSLLEQGEEKRDLEEVEVEVELELEDTGIGDLITIGSVRPQAVAANKVKCDCSVCASGQLKCELPQPYAKHLPLPVCRQCYGYCQLKIEAIETRSVEWLGHYANTNYLYYAVKDKCFLVERAASVGADAGRLKMKEILTMKCCQWQVLGMGSLREMSRAEVENLIVIPAADITMYMKGDVVAAESDMGYGVEPVPGPVLRFCLGQAPAKQFVKGRKEGKLNSSEILHSPGEPVIAVLTIIPEVNEYGLQLNRHLFMQNVNPQMDEGARGTGMTGCSRVIDWQLEGAAAAGESVEDALDVERNVHETVEAKWSSVVKGAMIKNCFNREPRVTTERYKSLPRLVRMEFLGWCERVWCKDDINVCSKCQCNVNGEIQKMDHFLGSRHCKALVKVGGSLAVKKEKKEDVDMKVSSLLAAMLLNPHYHTVLRTILIVKGLGTFVKLVKCERSRVRSPHLSIEEGVEWLRWAGVRLDDVHFCLEDSGYVTASPLHWLRNMNGAMIVSEDHAQVLTMSKQMLGGDARFN